MLNARRPKVLHSLQVSTMVIGDVVEQSTRALKRNQVNKVGIFLNSPL